jgi:phage terminase large subunit-like protein
VTASAQASPYATVLDAARWYAANPLATFKPSPALAPFMTDKASRILLRACNRGGKTAHAAARLSDLMCKFPNRRYRIVGTDFKQAQLVAGGYMHRFLPKSMLTGSSRFSEQRGWNYEMIELTNGTTCEIRTYEQKPDQHAGGDMDGVWCDEPPPPLIWAECLRRVFSRQGFLWLTFTPLGREVTWLRKVVEAERSDWKEYVVPLSAANCPWYKPEQIDAWINEVRTTMPDAYEQTINGAWEGPTGDRTFTGYDSSSHLVIGASESVADVLPRDVKWGVGVDHGEGAGKQWAGLVAWTGQGTGSKLWILDECVSKGVTTPNQDAKAIRLMLQRNGLDVVNVNRWKGDINTAGKGEPGRSANEVLAQHLAKEAGYHRFPREFESADKGAGSILKGEMLLNAAFLQRRAWVRADRCPVLSRSLAHYVADAKKSEDLKHPLDGLRYIAVPVLDPGEEIPTLGSVSLGFG